MTTIIPDTAFADFSANPPAHSGQTSTPAMHASAGTPAVALPLQPRLSRMYRMQYEQVQLAWVLLYPEGMVQLNGSAAEILRRCDGERTVDAIIAELQTLFGVENIGSQVRDMLQEGMRRGWIV